MPKKILIPLPSTDFDPTECAIPWKIFRQNEKKVIFATPFGKLASCDGRMLNGRGLGPLSPVLAADKNAREAYRDLQGSAEFQNPIPWTDIDVHAYDGLILPGGHAPGMKEYLESDILKQHVSHFFALRRPLGAICHGVVLAARSSNQGSSILKGLKTTALLYSQEMLAWSVTCLWLGRYYRTYEQTVQEEVTAALKSPLDFLKGPAPFKRDSPQNLKNGFTVQDGHYLSARWPGDAHRFGSDFLKMLS